MQLGTKHQIISWGKKRNLLEAIAEMDSTKFRNYTMRISLEKYIIWEKKVKSL